MNINQIASDYAAIMNALNALDQPRHDMYDATNRIRSQVDSCVNWQGEDAEAYKPYIKRTCNAIDSTAKWMNSVCYELKMLAQEMKRNAEEQAAEARRLANQGR